MSSGLAALHDARGVRGKLHARRTRMVVQQGAGGGVDGKGVVGGGSGDVVHLARAISPPSSYFASSLREFQCGKSRR